MIKNKLFIAPIVLILIIFISSFIVGSCKITEGVGKESKVTEDTLTKEETKEEISIAEDETIAEVTSISVEEIYEIIKNNQDYIILDVRTKEEFNEGHLEDAILIPVSELEGRLDELPKDKPIIVYCDGVGCSRSGRAAHILIDNGFREVYDMTGKGIIEWEEKGYPVEVGG